MAIQETLKTSRNEIEIIAAALTALRGAVDDAAVDQECRRLVDSRWTEQFNLDALLVAQDDRLSALRGLENMSIIARLGLTERPSFAGVAVAQDDPTGYTSTNLAGAACLLIWLERLGFATDATVLCDAVRMSLENASRVSDEERLAVRYREWRGKGFPVTVRVEPPKALGEASRKFTTSTGYQVEISYDTDGGMTMITSTAPNFHDPEEE